jgi:hypothetical protein
MQDSINQIELDGAKVGEKFKFIDQVINTMTVDENGTDWISGVTITVTESMIQDMQILLESAINQGHTLPVVDSTQDMPRFKYVSTTNAAAALSGLADSKLQMHIEYTGYDNLVIVDESDLLPDPPAPPMGEPEQVKYLFLLWTNDKTSVKLVLFDYFMRPDIVKIVYEYDDTEKQVSMLVSYHKPPLIDDGFDKLIIDPDKWDTDVNDWDLNIERVVLKEVDSAKRGDIVEYFQKIREWNGDRLDSLPPAKFFNFERTINGYADNDGGYAESTFTEFYNSYGESTFLTQMETRKFREKFSGNGTLESAQIFNDITGNWVDHPETPQSWTGPPQHKTKMFDNSADFDPTKTGKRNEFMSPDEALIHVKLPPRGLDVAGTTLFWGLTDFSKDFVIIAGSSDTLIDASSDWNTKVIAFGRAHRDPFFDQVNGQVVIPFVVKQANINVNGGFEPDTHLPDIYLYGVHRITGGILGNQKFQMSFDQAEKIYKL